MEEGTASIKIIGEGNGKIFFSSLDKALRAFLRGDVHQLTIAGRDAFFEFSGQGAVIKRISGGFEENFVDAPEVSLKLLGYNKDMTEFPRFTSLNKGFETFFENKVQGFQIYEQKRLFAGPFTIYTNYMVILDWRRRDPQKILLHLHNADATGNHFWGRDFSFQYKGNAIQLSPCFGEPHLPAPIFKN